MSVDENAVTQPILERIWSELAGISRDVRSIHNHLDEQDKKIANHEAATTLAGNIAARALATSEATEAVVRRIDQNLAGIYELAKSGFDIATAIKSSADTEPPPSEQDPVIEIGGVNGTYRIVGTGN